jgi:hypothetical protein
MSRRARRPAAHEEMHVEPQRTTCVTCGEEMWVAYHAHRKILMLKGLYRVTLVVRRCRNDTCPQ